LQARANSANCTAASGASGGGAAVSGIVYMNDSGSGTSPEGNESTTAWLIMSGMASVAPDEDYSF
jgi:hypothetical protein